MYLLITSDGANPSITSPTASKASSTGSGIFSRTLPTTSSGVGSLGSLNWKNYSWIDHSKKHVSPLFKKIKLLLTMVIIRGKCIVSNKNHIDPSLYWAWAGLAVVCFPTKRYESRTRVILLLGFGLSLTTKKPLKPTVTQLGHPSSKKGMSRAVFLEYYVLGRMTRVQKLL